MNFRRALFIVVAFVMLLPALPGSAGPAGPAVVPIGAGPLSSSNVELVGTIPDTGATGGRFVSNYFITTGSGSFPFVPTPNSGVRIYDVKNPELPILTGVPSITPTKL